MNLHKRARIRSMEMKVGVFIRDEVQELVDAFAACFPVKITFFSTEMAELSVGLRGPGSSYCRLVQKDLKLLYRCHALDRHMCRRAGAMKDSRLRYRCHAGLTEAIIPMQLDGKTIGAMMVGQIRETLKPPAEVVAAWTRTRGNPDGILEAWEELEFFDAERLTNMLRLFEVLVKFIVSQNYVTLRQGLLIERILRYVDDRLDERILLSKVASDLGRSESAIAHAVKKKLGISFGRLVNLKKIERFESIIAKEPSLTIQDVSAMVGFQDPLYFSRLYKTLRLISPSAFLAEVRVSISGTMIRPPKVELQ
jgi:AraC-like DNA-binding protein/ligand-binding sensor protein